MKILFALGFLLFTLAATFGVHVWIMIVGWGIPAASWGVIIGGWVIMVFLMTLTELAKAAMKD
jgi:hypothetical protein